MEDTDALFENFKNKSNILSAINDLQLFRQAVNKIVESTETLLERFQCLLPEILTFLKSKCSNHDY